LFPFPEIPENAVSFVTGNLRKFKPEFFQWKAHLATLTFQLWLATRINKNNKVFTQHRGTASVSLLMSRGDNRFQPFLQRLLNFISSFCLDVDECSNPPSILSRKKRNIWYWANSSATPVLPGIFS